MPSEEAVFGVVREWVQKAESDLTIAALALRSPAQCPTDAVCFHAQPCIEKYLKALLTMRCTPFPRTHDLAELLYVVPEDNRLPLGVEELERLTAYATVTRYPGDYEPIPLSEARAAVSLARRARAHIRRLLPPKLLRRRRKA